MEAFNNFGTLDALKAAMAAYAKESRCVVVTKRTRSDGRKGGVEALVTSIEYGCSGNSGKRELTPMEDPCCFSLTYKYRKQFEQYELQSSCANFLHGHDVAVRLETAELVCQEFMLSDQEVVIMNTMGVDTQAASTVDLPTQKASWLHSLEPHLAFFRKHGSESTASHENVLSILVQAVNAIKDGNNDLSTAQRIAAPIRRTVKRGRPALKNKSVINFMSPPSGKAKRSAEISSQQSA